MISNRQTAVRAASLGEVLGIDAQATVWMQDAVCAQTDPEAFHPDKSGSVEPAKAVCAGCPVLAQCRAYALEHNERFGVWGGLSASERQKIRANTDLLTDAVNHTLRALPVHCPNTGTDQCNDGTGCPAC